MIDTVEEAINDLEPLSIEEGTDSLEKIKNNNALGEGGLTEELCQHVG